MSDRESQQASIDASEASLPAENGSREVENDPPPLGRAFTLWIRFSRTPIYTSLLSLNWSNKEREEPAVYLIIELVAYFYGYSFYP